MMGGKADAAALVPLLDRRVPYRDRAARARRTLARVVAVAIVAVLGVGCAFARDDGRYAQSKHKDWFNQLKSKGGALCCSDADGTALSDVDWETRDNHYRVRINGEWIDVPDESVIIEPN